MTTEEPLLGGNDNRGAVVRVGDTVRRPPKSSTLAVRALLVHLEDCGFDGAPRFLDVDDQGREVLSFVEGDVPLPPYPEWAMTDRALDAMGELLRRFHAATASFDASGIDGWWPDWADPLGGPVVCHNDLCPENVVFRDGLPAALIDFDLAAPGRPFWDLGNAAQEWIPLFAPTTRRDYPFPLDAVARFGRFARAYGVPLRSAGELVDVVLEVRAHALAAIRRQVSAGNPVWVELWHDAGKEADAAVDDAWLADQREALIAAVGDQ